MSKSPVVPVERLLLGESPVAQIQILLDFLVNIDTPADLSGEESPYQLLWRHDSEGLCLRFRKMDPRTQIVLVQSELKFLHDYQSSLTDSERSGGGLGWVSTYITEVVVSTLHWLTFIPKDIQADVFPNWSDCATMMTTRHTDSDDPQRVVWHGRALSAEVLASFVGVALQYLPNQ